MWKLMPPSLLVLAAPVLAETPSPRIIVTGIGRVFTPPDLAVITFNVHGEGATSDAAVTALVAKRKAIDAGVRRVVDEPAKGGEVTIREVRDRACFNAGYTPPQLNAGACAITGYIADLRLEIRTRAIARAGTAVGLISRLGGSDPRIAAFALVDPNAEQRRAVAAALADAKARARAVADGMGVKLGAVLSASDGSYMPPPVAADAIAGAPPPPPPPPPPAEQMAMPVAIDITPRPIQTDARTSVTYEIAP